MEVATIKLLQNTYKKLMDEPVEGFNCVPHEDNFLVWSVYLEGPKDTPYEGGIFELMMEFPVDYPMEPPKLKFVSEFWHPNVFKDGNICISILHSSTSTDNRHNELESDAERWMPSQTVSSVILSVMSLLNDPNFSSPANIDASVMWRKDFEKYREVCKKIVEKANLVNRDIFIPHPETNPEERYAYLSRAKKSNQEYEMDDNEIDWGTYDDDENFDQSSIDDSDASSKSYQGSDEDDLNENETETNDPAIDISGGQESPDKKEQPSQLMRENSDQSLNYTYLSGTKRGPTSTLCEAPTKRQRSE
jgi:ubiquitin-conjugating enzyme E2 R